VEVDINDLGVIGGSSNGTYIYDATRVEFLDNLSWVKGIHSIKFGFDLNFGPERQQRETNDGGVYTFGRQPRLEIAWNIGGKNRSVNSSVKRTL
jgi:hypothetical protein